MPAAPQDSLVDRTLARLETVLPATRPIPLHEPTFDANAWVAVKDCLDSGWVSSVGAYVDRFERDLEEFSGLGHAIATVNGTAALHASLILAGVRPGDEVLLPALTFVGTANPIAAMGAVPHFVDSSTDTLGVAPDALADHLARIAHRSATGCTNRETGRPIRAIVVVHVLGHVADMQRLREIADDHGLRLIEDAAEALGSYRDERHAGAWGDLTALSFNGNKVITTGGGGAILTDDPTLARRAKHLTTTAKLPHAWAFDHDQVAFNYRLPNLNAALGVAQLERLPDLLEAKRRLADAYRIAFRDDDDLHIVQEPEGCRSNQWLNLLLVPDATARDTLLAAAHQRGLLLRPFWTPLHRLPMYASMPRADLPVANDLHERGVCLPSSPGLAPVERGTR